MRIELPHAPVAAKPQPDTDSAPYWAALGEERIELQRCSQCRRLRFPPLGRCPWCASTQFARETVDGAGCVYSWVVVHRAFQPSFATDVPYVIATVDLDAGPRLVVRLECPGPISFGMRLRPSFFHHADWTELRMTAGD